MNVTKSQISLDPFKFFIPISCNFIKEINNFELNWFFSLHRFPLKTFVDFSYWAAMLKQFLHGFPMICSEDIFGSAVDFCTTFIFLSWYTLQRVDEFYHINEFVVWELLKCDSISYYHKYFTFSSIQYAHNTTHLFPSLFFIHFSITTIIMENPSNESNSTNN